MSTGNLAQRSTLPQRSSQPQAMQSGRMTPLFTVFTATFNRRHTLGGVYESLRTQTLRDFEWVIVDDGSIDGTGELVTGWQAESDFPIRYFYQPNQGKHVAFNRGVREANGPLFLPFDSDDSCAANALERFKVYWESIPAQERDKFGNLSCLCRRNGKVVGSRYPKQVVDATSFWEQLRLRSGAERWGANRTDVLRAFPFPEFPGERYAPESLVWNRMSALYRSRFINEPLREYEETEDGITANVMRTLAKSPRGSSLYYRELMGYPVPVRIKLRSAVNYCRYSFHANAALARIVSESRAPVISILGLAPGYLLYRRDLSAFRKSAARRIS